VAAMFLHVSVDGPTLTVRKFTHRYSLEELVAIGTDFSPRRPTVQGCGRAKEHPHFPVERERERRPLLNGLAARDSRSGSRRPD